MSALISVFLPTFSRLYDGHLERAIQSVLKQTYRNFELLIIDDASVDGSKELIESYAKQDARIKHIRLKRNIGLPAYSIGQAYQQSKGQLLAFAYDDAILTPDHFAVLVHKLQWNPQLGMAYGQAHICWPDGSKTKIGSPYNAAAMTQMNNHIPNLSVMVRRGVIEKVGLYDPHVILSRFYDWDLWVRIAKHYPIGFVEKVIGEEHGTRLPDSIGHTFTLLSNLIHKYAQIERSHVLQPAVFVNYDPYSMKFEEQLAITEKLQFRYLLMEHYIKTHNIPRILQLMAEWPQRSIDGVTMPQWKKILAKNEGLSDIKQLQLLHGVLGYAGKESSLAKAELAKLRDLVSSKQKYIDEQQKFIDQREIYIQQQLIRIQELEIYIQEQARYIQMLLKR
ncbi:MULTISPECIES: glycosyltransferase family A protein [unclassified Paenibacillus]|uniref:glycosyltransferase family 2 protein n=1 Tax=unclassified Paenibacillus TaxID=185978 RepID=UPI002784B76A|nr:MULTISPECIES: glycosyltransferase family A protein [unclassified Paenibacillus]MDQ0901562.1 glycosyltransferase involved in cell wall biosynthesis [Paenibacillus sp. V4I7]MDQ0919936.1 glycosyltransferase involved in cell wall biosynthesis [Paenibacillus sp. V4I5]